MKLIDESFFYKDKKDKVNGGYYHQYKNFSGVIDWWGTKVQVKDMSIVWSVGDKEDGRDRNEYFKELKEEIEKWKSGTSDLLARPKYDYKDDKLPKDFKLRLVDGYIERGHLNRTAMSHCILLSGDCFNSYFSNGEFQGDKFSGGLCEMSKSIWKVKEFSSGYLDDCTWYGGKMTGGHFVDGVWEDGEFRGGHFIDSKWKKGFWKTGTFDGGVFEDGVWENGTWKSGTFSGGTWKKGLWENGTWEDGVWEYGTWIEGEWKGGTWHSGFDSTGQLRFTAPDTWVPIKHIIKEYKKRERGLSTPRKKKEDSADDPVKDSKKKKEEKFDNLLDVADFLGIEEDIVKKIDLDTLD